MLVDLENTKVAIAEWAVFCRGLVEDGKDILGFGGELIVARDLSRRNVDLKCMMDLTREEALVLMRREREKREVFGRSVTEKRRM